MNRLEKILAAIAALLAVVVGVLWLMPERGLCTTMLLTIRVLFRVTPPGLSPVPTTRPPPMLFEPLANEVLFAITTSVAACHRWIP